MKQTLKEKIELVVIGDNNYEIVAPKGFPAMGTVGVKPQMVKNLVALFKQWALEMVGPDQDWTDYQPESSKIEARGANRLKGQLRQRIEESD